VVLELAEPRRDDADLERSLLELGDEMADAPRQVRGGASCV